MTPVLEVLPLAFLDHALVTVTLGRPVPRTRKSSWWSSWKLNESLIEDEQLRTQIKELLEGKTGGVPMNAVTWEELKEDVKLKAFRHSQEKAARERAEKRRLMKTLEILIAEENRSPGLFSQDIRDCKGNILELLEKEYRGAMVRSRTLFLERDEEPSKIFKTKERQHAARNKIGKLQAYTDLFTRVEDDGVLQTTGVALPKISPKVRKQMNRKITASEVEEAIKELAPHKSPGVDGLGSQFYKTFSAQLCPILRDVYADVLKRGLLPPSMRQAVTVLIQKKNSKGTPKVNHFRPISLLTSDYKILAKILAKRLEWGLRDVVGEHQAYGIKRRTISTNLHAMRIVCEAAQVLKLPVAVLQVDLSKAFDRVRHSFLFRLMKECGIGVRLLRYVQLCYRDITTRLLVNGNRTAPIAVTRSVALCEAEKSWNQDDDKAESVEDCGDRAGAKCSCLLRLQWSSSTWVYSGHKAENCKGRQSEKHQASWLYTVPTDNFDDADDSYVTLNNGDKIPVVNAVMGRAPKFLSENMPVVEGRLCEHKITVLRDTCCNTVVVRKELVPQENLTGKSSPVFLLDRTVRYLPEAVIVIQTPYYTGKVTAKCVSNPLYDLILGNIPQMRDELWSNEALKEDMKMAYGYILELREKLEETCKLAHVCLHEAREKYKGYYDRKSCNRNMKQGDLALILLPTDLNKMIMQWKGPFPVVARKNDVNYEFDVGGKKKVFHINMLKRYEEREGSQQGRQHCGMAVDSLEKDKVASELSFEYTVGIPTPSWTRQQEWEDVNINKHLECQKRDEVRELNEDFEDIFSNLPGRPSLLTCDLQLTTSRPIHVKQYPQPLSVQETVEQEITEMLELDVIERCTSSYNAPVLMVKKKDGSSRFCIDYRRLNDVTKPDAEPIPRIDVMFAEAGQNRFFSKLDVAKGYWQIPMKEEAKEKTAFSSTSGLYQFKVMPFGLRTASATFTKLMQKLLDGTPDAHHCIEDILIATSLWREQVDTLRCTFRRLRQANITVKPKKCDVGFKEISFLGHEIGMGRISPDPKITERIQDVPRPRTKGQVRSFFGLTGFYREFVEDYAGLAAPLVDLTRKGARNEVE
ncbi:uncharacterized protein ISCGN_007017 [Ixodes scapularis]